MMTTIVKLTEIAQQVINKTKMSDNMSKVFATTTKILIEAQSDNNTNNDNNQTGVNENNISQEAVSNKIFNILAKTNVLEKTVQSIENNESANNQKLNTTVVAQNLTKVIKVVTKKDTNKSEDLINNRVKSIQGTENNKKKINYIVQI